MPAAFFGHGNPMNALEINRYTTASRAFGAAAPRDPRHQRALVRERQCGTAYTLGLSYPHAPGEGGSPQPPADLPPDGSNI